MVADLQLLVVIPLAFLFLLIPMMVWVQVHLLRKTFELPGELPSLSLAGALGAVVLFFCSDMSLPALSKIAEHANREFPIGAAVDALGATFVSASLGFLCLALPVIFFEIVLRWWLHDHRVTFQSMLKGLRLPFAFILFGIFSLTTSDFLEAFIQNLWGLGGAHP